MDERYVLGALNIPEPEDVDINTWVENMFSQWSSEVEEPDSDYDFIIWMIDNHGCEEVPCMHEVVIEQ
jgi:hypothetical protein